MLDLITGLLAAFDLSAVGDLAQAGWRVPASDLFGGLIEAGMRVQP